MRIKLALLLLFTHLLQSVCFADIHRDIYSESSVLASGNWYKVAVEESGMHKLSYENLQDLGLSNPSSVKIFGAGAILLSEIYSDGSYDDLQEIPLFIEKGSDNSFGPGDFILFYANGINEWKYNETEQFFNPELHHYANEGYYFITDSKGPAIQPETISSVDEAATYTCKTYDYLDYLEEETNNLILSGREWYGSEYYTLLEYSHAFQIPMPQSSASMKLKVVAAGRSGDSSTFAVKVNGEMKGLLDFRAVNMSSHTSTYAREEAQIFEFQSKSDLITVVTSYNQPDNKSYAWLNYLSLNARLPLQLSGSQTIFRDISSIGHDQVTEYQLNNANSNTIIWEISHTNIPKQLNHHLSGSTASFTLHTSELRTFIAFDKTGTFPSPRISGEKVGPLSNQNIHGRPKADMLIVYPELFAEQANRLAEHRRSNDQLDVMLVSETEVFNEFSSGTPNVCALRNMLKMYYNPEAPEEMIKYLLLFGDGSFANKLDVDKNPNLLLTYQSPNSLTPSSSFVSDDFFGLLDDGENLYSGMLDIGIGRLPVSDVQNAEYLVDKLIAYDQLKTIGEWRNYICFIGDDEDGNTHMRQANSLAEDVETHFPEYNISKIFLDAYPQESTATGDRYPSVTQAINEQIARGALIINYTGHGGMSGMAHERIVDISHIKAWDNEGMWPLFMTATCEFSRYDYFDTDKNEIVVSPGEEVILNPVGGAIALFTTTRLVYSGPNHTLNEKFYERVFDKQENGDCYRLGDIIKYSKNKAGSGYNKRNFTLLGDPATALAFPKNKVVTDSINHLDIQSQTDTISALEYVTIHGHIEDAQGNIMNHFNGSIIPVVYDKESQYTTFGNDGGSTLDFELRNNILYKGKASVTNGYFEYSFYVPLDISYKVGKGKISYYAMNDSIDGHGSTYNITIGEIGALTIVDNEGPEIELYMNDTLFKNKGIVDESPELLIQIRDMYGINTTGNGIGHDITAILDDDRINAKNLNSYYEANMNSYSSGFVRYPYQELSPGIHSIEVKVWDILNNSSTDTIEFLVVDDFEMLLEQVYNYPNPFTKTTWFNIEHNRTNTELEVFIHIYDLSGNLKCILNESHHSDGYRIPPIEWAGTNGAGASLGGGIYVYRVVVQTEQGEEALDSGKLIINR